MEKTLFDFVLSMLQLFVLLPVSIIVYLPMKNLINENCKKKLVIFQLITFVVSVPIVAYLKTTFELTNSIAVLAIAIVSFFVFHFTAKCNIFKEIFIYMSAIFLMLFCSMPTYYIDAYIHPTGRYETLSLEATLFLLFICTVLSVISAIPMKKYYGWLMENIDDNAIWCQITIMPLCLIVASIIMIPHEYQNMYVGRSEVIFLITIFMIFITTIFVYSMFYRISKSTYNNMELQKTNQLLSIQATQYEDLTKHVEEMRRIRHDFRQQMRTVYGLAQDEDCPKVMEYLKNYIDNTSTSVEKFCLNSSTNSIVGYYFLLARSYDIKTTHKINLPEKLEINETDFCSMLGNLLENSVQGCLNVAPEKRYLSVSIAMTNTKTIALIIKNSCDGKIKINHNKFMSTKHSGEGIGIASVKATVDKYNGVINIEPTDNQFTVNILLFLK